MHRGSRSPYRTRFYVKTGVGAALLIFLVFLVLRQTRDVREGGVLSITDPHDGAIVSEPFITIRGVAKKIAFMRLNGRQIWSDKNGLFEEPLLLAPGYTIITLSAQDVFERTREKQVGIVYIPAEETSTTSIQTETVAKKETTHSSLQESP